MTWRSFRETFSINPLVTWAVSINIAYFAMGIVVWMLPGGGNWWSAFVGATLAVFGGALAITAIPQSFAVLKRGETGPGELAAIAIALMAGGMMYSGIFSIAYYLAGRPDSWIGVFSSYGRACVAVSMILMLLAPDATRAGLRSPRPVFILASIVLTALIGFVLGWSFSDGAGTINSLYIPFESTRSPSDFSLLFTRRA